MLYQRGRKSELLYGKDIDFNIIQNLYTTPSISCRTLVQHLPVVSLRTTNCLFALCQWLSN